MSDDFRSQFESHPMTALEIAEVRTKGRHRSVTVAAICGLIVSIPTLFAGGYLFAAFILSYLYDKRFADLRPELKLHPASIFFDSTFLFFSMTVLLSILCTATATGLLRGRDWARPSAAFVMPSVAWLTFFGTLWAHHNVAGLPSGAMLVVGEGLILAILTFYILPWFLVISLWWLILFRSARSWRWDIDGSQDSGATSSTLNQ
jgi:hypothetical protein